MEKLIVLTGPTAVGKTDLSIKLAKKINGEIISADSIQVYRGFDIGSAKISKEEMQGVPHHLIDVLDPTDDFNVYIFKEMAKWACDEIYAKGHIPIIVGGTGFYIQALLYDIDFAKEDNSKVRKRLEDEAKKEGINKLYERLKELDPEYALSVHPNNEKRVIRALEYIELNGKKFSTHNEEESNRVSPYDFNYFVLNDERKKLYERIDKRVDIMMENGLLNEVSALLNSGISRESNAMQGIGYKEFIPYFDGLKSLDEVISDIKQDSRHFAKRQLTWFRREKCVTFIDRTSYHSDDEILDFMLGEIYGKESQ